MLQMCIRVLCRLQCVLFWWYVPSIIRSKTVYMNGCILYTFPFDDYKKSWPEFLRRGIVLITFYFRLRVGSPKIVLIKLLERETYKVMHPELEQFVVVVVTKVYN